MAKRTKRNGYRAPPTYRAYVFPGEQDPAIDQLRTLAEKHFGHSLKHGDLVEINRDGGPSIGCMDAWFRRKTKRPNHATLEAAGRAMGYERTWKRMRSNQ